MKRESYSIVFSSLTGNTKKLADVIHETLPKNECDYFGTIEAQVPQSKLLYVGFWTDKGNADHKTLELLSKLKNKKIFLFGTAGFGGSDVYFQKILGQIRQSIDSSNVIVGEYMCQGKMPQSVNGRCSYCFCCPYRQQANSAVEILAYLAVDIAGAHHCRMFP